MTKRLNSKHKVDRRLKVNLWGRPKSPFNTRAYPPGQHGQTKSAKPSDYGIQLQAKQKLKSYYGNMNERQFRNMYKKAIMKKGDTAENLIGLLERRLDAVIYRSKLSNTIFSSRQLINHGHVKVNGKKVNISSYLVREEDTIEIRDKSKQMALVDIALANKERETPEYIQLDQKNKTLELEMLSFRVKDQFVWGEAEKALAMKNKVSFKEAKFSLCPCEEKIWWIESEKVDLETKENNISFKKFPKTDFS